jgi:hypothetical protein
MLGADIKTIAFMGSVNMLDNRAVLSNRPSAYGKS